MNVLENQMMLILIAKRHFTKNPCSGNEVIWTAYPLRKSPILPSEVTYWGRKSFSQRTNIWPKSSSLKCQFPDLNGTHMGEEKKKKKQQTSICPSVLHGSIDKAPWKKRAALCISTQTEPAKHLYHICISFCTTPESRETN